ncbi:ribosomal protection-like ABC-F family protein [Anaerofustis stercorihominis]|uniref:ABC-F type ribosomal protection protein n=1 Tax=Anaerofustis stercorihominis TaxID=214853 RepID=A0A3E3DYC7_9FIRM|nr:ABC-F type ribosomal protection protein [Anaerofustis stercorihominis]RGD74272.1 ABC-F type ribosomal protection protein [Anaerofustis stercorihominis]
MSLININNLTFAYEGTYENIFENVNLNIDSSWKLGLIGRNGRGKTTFLNLLLGKYEYKGTINTKVNFEYFPFEINDLSKLTIEIVEDINPNYEYWQIAKELNLLSVDEEVLYRPFYTLSNGERIKIMLASLFTKENSFLLIDEPTNHLDMEAREKLTEYLNSKSGFILVSHDRTLLDNSVDHIISINKNKIDLQKGNFSSYFTNKEREDKFELTQNEKLKSEISELTEASKRTTGWSNEVEKTKYNKRNSGLRPDRGFIGHKSAKMMQRAKAIEKRRNASIEEKSKLLKNIEKQEDLKIVGSEYHTKLLLRLNHLNIYYDDKEAVHDVTFNINKGDRVILKGKNGSGKSSILKLILGKDIKYSGDLYKGSSLKISYISQDTSFLKGSFKDFCFDNGIDETIFKTNLRKLDFERSEFEKDLEDLSSGQKKKVLIAKSLTERANLYIWDEPLNFIDVFSRIQIEDVILKYKPTMIIVEHDKAFIDKVGSKVVELD